MRKAIYLIIFALGCGSSAADEYVVSLGTDDVLDQTGTQSSTIGLEYHWKPFHSGSAVSYSWAGGVHFDQDEDLFIGAGIHAHWSFANGPWFLEANFMPGYYKQGTNGTPLDGNLQFRSLLGFGREISQNSRISIAIDHKSNAQTQDTNPGSETLSVRYTHILK